MSDQDQHFEPLSQRTGWQLPLFAQELAQHLAPLTAQLEELETSPSMGTGETVENPITDARERLLVHKVIIDRVDRILTPEMIAKVFESSYEEGHDDVQEVAAEIAGVFVALLKWGHEVRDVNVEESWHIIYSALLNFAIKPLHEILDFSRRCDAQVLDAAQSATTPPTLSFIPSLHLSLDENDIVSFSVAMQDVKSVLPPEPVVKRKGLFRRVAS